MDITQIKPNTTKEVNLSKDQIFDTINNNQQQDNNSLIISMQEIKDSYPERWVVIANVEVDDKMNIIRGEVIVDSTDRDELYKKLLSINIDSVAIEYTGCEPEELAIML